MKILVLRDPGDINATPGEMLLDGVHECWTLEPRRDQSQGKPYCVDSGIYPIILGWSDHFQMTVPKVQDVPNFDAVEIHPGDFPKDTHACCLVGETKSTDAVWESRIAFNTLMQKLRADSDPENITIEYRDRDPNQG